jgi:hypothetical protein
MLAWMVARRRCCLLALRVLIAWALFLGAVFALQDKR